MDFVSTIIGGLIAAGAGWFLQTRIYKTQLTRSRDLLLTGIKDDLQNSVDLMKKLEEYWDTTKTIGVAIMAEIIESRHIYTDHKDHLILINNDSLRRSIAEYYRKSGNTLVQIQTYHQRNTDILHRAVMIQQQILATSPDLDLNEAGQRALTQFPLESRELAENINTFIPTLLRKLKDHRNDAQRLLDKFGTKS